MRQMVRLVAVVVALAVVDATLTAFLSEQWMWRIAAAFSHSPHAVDNHNRGIQYGKTTKWEPYHEAGWEQVEGCTYLWALTLPTLSFAFALHPNFRERLATFVALVAWLWFAIVVSTVIIYEFAFFMFFGTTAWQKAWLASCFIVCLGVAWLVSAYGAWRVYGFEGGFVAPPLVVAAAATSADTRKCAAGESDSDSDSCSDEEAGREEKRLLVRLAMMN